MRYAPRAILACGLGFAVSFLAACGGGRGLLSGDQSITLNGQADQIASAVQNGQCGAAVNASQALNRDVQNLPATINPTLRQNLIQGASTIARLAPKDCHLHTATQTPTSTTSSSTTTTPSTTTTSTSTSTSTSSTSSTSTTATTPTVPGNSSSTTGGAGLGGSTTTGTGIGTSGGTGPGTTTSSGPGGGG